MLFFHLCLNITISFFCYHKICFDALQIFKTDSTNGLSHTSDQISGTIVFMTANVLRILNMWLDISDLGFNFAPKSGSNAKINY